MFQLSITSSSAIEAKQTAQQNALKAEQDLQRIKVEAQQTIEAAQAEAEAYRLKSEQITPEIILMSYIEKWDGKLPTVASGDGSMMLDISSLMADLNKASGGVKTPVYNNVTDNQPAPETSAEEIQE